ncbi:MAG: PQQ-dependent sugar dehydrogenase [Bacteroidota bacterium]|nr:PQQ-dependent sugar dehydrogenase [Bacteroidota bacterium]
MKIYIILFLIHLIINENIFAQEKNELANDPISINYNIEKIYDHNKIIWGFEFINEKTIIFTEKKGKMYLIKDGKIQEISGIPEIYYMGQGGLMDIELHPKFNINNTIFLSFSESSNKSEGGNTAIMSAILDQNKLINKKILYRGKENSKKGQHWGSRIEFDKDGFLYFTIGDRGNRNSNPQDLSRDGGKVYRINEDGSIPKDNPFVNQPNAIDAIYSYGHRNPQGIFLHPETGMIWTNEHGPKGGDEINIIRKGKNYGWPTITYGKNYNGSIITDLKEFYGMEQPLYYWTPSIAPSCFEYISSNRYNDWKGNLLAGSLSFGYLERLVLDNQNKVVYREKIAKDIGRVRDVVESPEGFIYFSVENEGIFKLVPKKD